MASASPDNIMASGGEGGWKHPPPKISGTTIGLSMKFLADVGIYNVAQNV